MDRDYLACLAWLALWPSWCDTGGPPSLLRPASSRAQPVPCGQTTLSTALSGLHGPSDTNTRLTLSCCNASAVSSQIYTFIPSIFDSLASRREAKLCSVALDQTLPGDWKRKAGAFTV